MKTPRMISRILAVAALAGAASAQTLNIDCSLIADEAIPITSTLPSTPNNQVTLAVENGPAFGSAFIAFSQGVISPVPTSYGNLLLNPSGLTYVGAVPLNAVGTATITSQFGPLGTKFQQAYQVATFDPITSAVQMTSTAQLGYGTVLFHAMKARIAYSESAQSFKMIATSKTILAQPVLVEHIDASAGQTHTISSSTIPGGTHPNVSVLQLTDAIDLDAGDSLVVTLAGQEAARIDT